MNTASNLEQLNDLRLWGMARSYESVLQLPVHQLPTTHEMVAQLAQAEHLHRKNIRTEAFLRNARFRYKASVEELQCSAKRNLDKGQILALADCSYIQRAENIVITGATGCGKSYVASALGNQACLMGFKVRYFNLNKLAEIIFRSKADGSFAKELVKLEKQHLIILDDFGIRPLENEMKLALLQIMEDRHGLGSTIITSQLPVSKWYEYFNAPTIADAIMDRLLASVHRLELKGESMRKNKAEQKEKS